MNDAIDNIIADRIAGDALVAAGESPLAIRAILDEERELRAWYERATSKQKLAFDRAIRARAGEIGRGHKSRVVVQWSGDVDPDGDEAWWWYAGESYHWETRGGTRVRHPSAYARKGWSNLVYVASDRRIVCSRSLALDTIRALKEVAS